MQIAAHEARSGHGKFAEELRALIDKAKSRSHLPSKGPIPLARTRGEVAELLTVSYPSTRLSDMVLGDSLPKKLDRVLREHKTVRALRNRGISPRRALQLIGTPGPGRYNTARTEGHRVGGK